MLNNACGKYVKISAKNLITLYYINFEKENFF